MKALIAAVAALTLVGCTDARMAKFTALGDPAHVVCYSGGQKIYDGYSTGKVSNADQSDGYFFKDAKDQKLKEVSGDCVVTYAVTAPQ